MINNETINQIINDYNGVIKKFKLNSKVIDGTDIAWRGNGYLDFANKPKDYGSGTTTTGWCVSASEALLKSKGFELLTEVYGGYAKLISIDIKEQYHGYCYNGSQNKWHTAILIQIDNFKFVIDITCGQFGNDYVNKNVWFLDAWMTKFRSAFCNHKLYDFDNNELKVLPANKATRGKHEMVRNKYNLSNFTTIDDNDRKQLINFIEDFENINNRLILGTYQKSDVEIMQNVIAIYKKGMGYTYLPEAWCSLRFDNKTAAFNWLNKNINFSGHDEYSVINFDMKQNLLVFESVEKCREYYGNKISDSDKNSYIGNNTTSTYKPTDYILNIKFINVNGLTNFTTIKNYILFAGTQLSVDMSNFTINKTAIGNESTVMFLGDVDDMVHLNEGKNAERLGRSAKKYGANKIKNKVISKLAESESFDKEFIDALGWIMLSDWKNEPTLSKYISTNKKGNLEISIGKIKELSTNDIVALSKTLKTVDNLDNLNEGERAKRVKRAAKKVGKVAAKGVGKVGNYLNYIAED